MIPSPPPGQGPIDPRGAMSPPPPPGPFPEGPIPTVDPSAPVSQGATNPWQQVAAGMPPAAGPVAGAPIPPMPTMGPSSLSAGPGGAPPGLGWVPMQRPPGAFPPAPPPPPRRGGAARVVLLVLLLLFLGMSVVLNLALLVGNSAGVSSGSQTTLVSGATRDQVAILPIEGVIDEPLADRFERFLRRAKDDGNVKAIVVEINTPGGSVTASDEIYRRLIKFKADKSVPVVVAMRTMATSGGYYAACAADYIVAERTTLTGNIGVLMPRYNVSKLLEKWGVEDNTVVATGATYKYSGSPYRPSSPADDAYFQNQVDADFTLFKQIVSDGRKGKLVGNIDDIANGKAYTGDEALKLGLIDEIDTTGFLDVAVAHAAKSAGITNPTVIKYQEKPSILDILSQAKYAGGQPGASGVNINIDASLLDRLSTPRMMYLYNGAPAARVGK
jgi:protease-4